MEYVTVKDNKSLSEMEFTSDGYVVCNGLYIGLISDDIWDWYYSYDECKNKAKPLINFKMIDIVKEYVDNY